MRATFEQNGDFIALAGREAREEAQRLLARLEILIAGLAAKDPHAGLELRRAAVEFLVASGDQPMRSGLAVVASARPADRGAEKHGELESILLELVEGDEAGMHVDSLFELLTEMGVEVTRGNLSVKLHRMIKAGRLVSTGRGCYGLSAMERARRMAG